MKFWYMAEHADSLAAENARLMAAMRNAKYINNEWSAVDTTYMDTTISHADTIRTIDIVQQFHYIAAGVVGNSIVQQYNYLTINRGSNHGIRKDMGVFTDKGLVGIVIDVTPHFARVMSVLNEQSNISVSVKKNNYFGSLSWHTRDPRFLNLDGIPKHANLVKGDTLVTSGFSELFPPGLLVGVIDAVSVESGSNFYTCSVKLEFDMGNIQHVYVIDNLMVGERTFLKNKNPDGE